MLLNLKSNALCPWVCVTPSKQKEFSFLVSAAAESGVAFSRKSVLEQAFIFVSVFVKKQFQCCAGVLLDNNCLLLFVVKFAQINCNNTWHLKSNWKVNWKVKQAGPVIICDGFLQSNCDSAKGSIMNSFVSQMFIK